METDDKTLKMFRCPCCREPLYTLVLQEHKGWQLTRHSPSLQTDDGGSFMKCRRCFRRIAMETTGITADSPGFELATKQDCA